MKLIFQKGTILLQGINKIPYAKWDPRSKCYRAQALFYKETIEFLKQSEFIFDDEVLDLLPCPYFKSNIKLRKYQNEAVNKWLEQKKGIIIMPTGSGKTLIAIKIIEKVNSPAFIVVPTLDLVKQWKNKLKDAFNMQIGEYTGEKKDLQAITVSTYDSAYINAENLGNKFKLLIFDEVHHLPSEGYKQIAEMFASPYRLGLTATFEREDGLHEELPRLLGNIVFEAKTEDLSGKYLANYEIIRIPIELTEDEQNKYEDFHTVFKNYIVSNKIHFHNARDFRKIVMRSGQDPQARKALLARNAAEKIAYNSKNKLEKIKELLNKENRTIIFTKYNDMVYNISQNYFIPCITHKTARNERNEILKKFKDGDYSVIASSQVLDEGIDVPEANVGIILSGTGSSRSFTQRLGRLLRPQIGKKAVLYELVTKKTMEMKTANRRKK